MRVLLISEEKQTRLKHCPLLTTTQHIRVRFTVGQFPGFPFFSALYFALRKKCLVQFSHHYLMLGSEVLNLIKEVDINRLHGESIAGV